MLPDWTGRTVAVLGAGPSASEIAPHIAGRFPIIAVNMSFRLVTASDLLYAADGTFWRHCRDARSFPGLKICPDPRILDIMSEALIVTIPKNGGFMHKRLIRWPVGTIGAGGNGGFQAVNIAAQLAPARILLAGLDYTGAHWHGDHKSPFWNPRPDTMKKWRDALDAEAATLASWGIEVLNLSPQSTLRNYRHATAESIR